MRIVALPIVLGLALVLSACGGVPSPAETVAEQTPISTPTRTPTPEPTRPALAEVSLSTAGLGTLLLGGPVPDTDDPATAMVSSVADLCVSQMYHVAAGDPKAVGWLPDPSYDVSGQHGFEIYAPDRTLQRIDITVAGIATDAGVKVGDPESAVTASYPTAAVHDLGPWDRLYVVDGPTGSLGVVVDVTSKKVRLLRATSPALDQVDVAGQNTNIAGCVFVIP